MAEYNEQEQDIIRRAAYGAIALVSKADPGILATFKESAAGSKVLAAAPESIKGLFRGGLVSAPRGDATQVEQTILAELRQAVQTLAKNPTDQAAYKNVLTTAIQQVAEASKGVTSSEQAVISKITQALGISTADTPPAGAPQAAEAGAQPPTAQQPPVTPGS